MDDTKTEIRAFAPDDAAWLIAVNIAHYAASDRFDESFGDAVRAVVAGFAAGHDPATERAWIATMDGAPVGSVFCVKTDDPLTARLKLLFVVDKARGMGLGQRLLDTCIGFARSSGRTRLVISTHESHREAAGLYRKNGFALLGSEARRSFGQDVVELLFVRDLI